MVGVDDSGNGWCDQASDGGGNDSPEDGAACNWSDVAVGFEEWDDAGTGQRVEGFGGTWLVAKSVRTSVRAWCVAGYEATTA